MNIRCTICDAVLPTRPGGEHCPQCGARSVFFEATAEPPRPAKDGTAEAPHAWDIDPDGPILR